MQYSTNLANLRMLFILGPRALQQVQACSKIYNIPNVANFGINHAIRLKLIPPDGALYTEHNGTMFAAIYEILMEGDHVFVLIDDIGRALSSMIRCYQSWPFLAIRLAIRLLVHRLDIRCTCLFCYR